MKNPLVVGYRGEIGKYILRGLLDYLPKANTIWCVDVNDIKSDVSDRIQRSDVIFLCIPIEKTKEWILEHRALLLGKTLVEQTSIKGWLADKEIVEKIKYFNIDVLSMHILFRPSATPEHKDRTIALVGKRWTDKKYADLSWFCSAFNGLFSQTVYFKTWQKHDEEMALQQAVVHRVLLTLGDMIEKLPYTTYIGKQVLGLKSRIQRGDYKLYRSIQGNPYLKKKLTEFNSNMKGFKLEKHYAQTLLQNKKSV